MYSPFDEHLRLSLGFIILSFFLGFSTCSFSDGDSELYRDILRDEAVGRLEELGKISDADKYLERTFLSPASLDAGNLIRKWMETAGLKTWVDRMGNVHGRTDGMNGTAKVLIIGSHLDTVVDAGIFDGSLGIVAALSALRVLNIHQKLSRLIRPVEVIAFSDEEGIRFQSTFLGSAAIAGILPVSTLQISDKRGVTIHDVLKKNFIKASEDDWFQIQYDPKSVWGYVEVHIEQGPVLESIGVPLGVVDGIAGQTRLKVTVEGSQGHAGTVPMFMRRDPMSAAAEMIVALEKLCKHPDDHLPCSDGYCSGFSADSLSRSLVCTVGEISCWPSASNVIPGSVSFTVDLRAIDDMGREAVIHELLQIVHHICERRSVSCEVERKHDADAVMCDNGLKNKLIHAAKVALTKLEGGVVEDHHVPKVMSGAGHDAMPMSRLTNVGMLFVRCHKGISHSPAEHVSEDDVWAAGLALLAFLDPFILPHY